MKEKVKKIQNLLELLYPEVCFWCEEISKENPCKKCQRDLENIAKYKIENNKKEGFKHAYLFYYEGKIRRKILDYKFNEKSYLKNGFINLFIKNQIMYDFIKNYDIIISVPIHKNKKIKRGYNQSELIAKGIVDNVENLKMEKNILKKIQDNVPQSTLNRKMRKDNVKGVYKVDNNEKIVNKKIILFDDIYTTGNTVKECIKILKIAGAKQVDVLTIAKD